MENVFLAILTAVRSTLNYLGDLISSLVIGLAFVMSCVRILGVMWSKGYDQTVPYFKEQLMKFVIVIALALPMNIGPIQGSFITEFPQLIIKGGFITAEQMFSQGGVPSGTSGGLIGLPGGLRQKILQGRIDYANDPRIQDLNKQLQDEASSMFGLRDVFSTKFFKVLVYTLLFSILSLPIIVILVVSGQWPAIAMVLTINFLMAVTAATNQSSMSGLVGGGTIITDLITAVVDFIFVATLTFTYYGVLISTLIKGVIYSLTFPFTILNMPFESQKAHFITGIVRIFTLAVTPIVAIVIFLVSALGYSYLTAPDGVVDQMIKTYVGIPGGTFNDLIAWYFRWMFTVFFAPVAMCLPVARYMIMAPRIAGELLGSGISATSGLAEKAARFGTFGLGR